MTIDEAIEALQYEANRVYCLPQDKIVEACRIAIEGLKRLKDLRSQRVIPEWERLPYETEDKRQ
jgi:hypothetical protein